MQHDAVADVGPPSRTDGYMEAPVSAAAAIVLQGTSARQRSTHANRGDDGWIEIERPVPTPSKPLDHTALDRECNEVGRDSVDSELPAASDPAAFPHGVLDEEHAVILPARFLPRTADWPQSGRFFR